jgi:hypothetical protein
MKIIAISYDKPPVMENETRQKTVVHREVGLKIKYVQFFYLLNSNFKYGTQRNGEGVFLKASRKRLVLGSTSMSTR